jgi:hypothetical protein
MLVFVLIFTQARSQTYVLAMSKQWNKPRLVMDSASQYTSVPELHDWFDPPEKRVWFSRLTWRFVASVCHPDGHPVDQHQS